MGNVPVWGLGEGLQRVTINNNLLRNVTQGLVLYFGGFFGMSQAMESAYVMWNLECGDYERHCHCMLLRESTVRVGLMGRLDFRWEKSGYERAEDDNTFYRK